MIATGAGTKDMSGQRFGRLVAVDIAGRTRNGLTWNCKCDCGAGTVVLGVRLRDGTTVSCGCKRKIEHVAGERFGMLTVIEKGERVQTRPGSWNVTWRCRCDCGNEATVHGGQLRSGRTTSCGCYRKSLRGEKHHGWKGGRTKNSEGYILALKPDHPRSGPSGYVLEHIVVMEKHIGRSLVEGETVHHVNGDRSDNRIDNLELWSTRQPKGQRIQDKVQYAIEILSLYGTAEDIAKIARKS